MAKTSKPMPASAVYQLKISLKGSKQPIWRRILVPSNLPLEALHEAIQLAMGWDNDHLHQFTIGTKSYFDDPFGLTNEFTEADCSPAEFTFKEGTKFLYQYDFGDSWKHEVLVEKRLPADPDLKHPVCLAGRNACPPEDSGGLWGYYYKLDALADPKNPDHADLVEWMGRDWDPARFDLAEINRALTRLTFLAPGKIEEE